MAASLQVRQGCAALIQSVAMQAEIRCYDVEIPPESLIDSQHPDIIHPGYVASPARTSRPLDLPARTEGCLTTTGGTSENWSQLLA